jgi:hypothetical protein
MYMKRKDEASRRVDELVKQGGSADEIRKALAVKRMAREKLRTRLRRASLSRNLST